MLKINYWRNILKIDNKLSARQQNLRSILDLLDEYDQLSAKQLANLTSLSIVSINKLLDILNSKGNLIATDHLNTRGRRAKLYKLNYDAYKLGVVQLAEENNQIKATYFLTNLLGKINHQHFNDQQIDSIEQLTDFIKNETKIDKPCKLIVGVPGSEIDGYLQISDIKALQGINLSLAIKTATGLETMIVNDANASTFGAALELNENQNISVGVYFPNNFGAGVGIVINNHLINGASGLAGEIQYSTVDTKIDISQQIIQHVQNIISFLDPNLIIVYAENLQLSSLQTDRIKQTIQRNLPLHDKYQLDFDRDFSHDYLLGLTAIGRKNILKDLATN